MIWDKLFSVFKYCVIPAVMMFVVGMLFKIIIEGYRIERS